VKGVFVLKRKIRIMNSIKKLNKNNERHAENKKKNVRRAGIVFLADFRRRRELYQKSWNRSRA